ncbi:MAG: hypothetical protein HY508_00655 [Acidobacteria bacterium]|nr:hypothetical protein [Acidobacteriota bacterium]
MAPERYEESLQEFLIAALFARVGEPGTLRGEGKTASFAIHRSLGGGSCAAQVLLTCTLPQGRTLTHTADMLVTLLRGKLLAIDLKWAASEIEPIKARAFDMLLLKQSLGEKLWGMMIYLRPAGGGITGEQAREICFPFDQFFAIEHQDPQNPAAWVPILDRIEAEIGA